MNSEISATDNALLRIQKMCQKQATAIGIRLSVKDQGCSGKGYMVTLAHQEDIQPEDYIIHLNETLKLYVDPTSFPFLAGTRIDYVKKGLNGKFVFHNPNEKASCGCGESFYV